MVTNGIQSTNQRTNEQLIIEMQFVCCVLIVLYVEVSPCPLLSPWKI